ncbi:MAG: phospho-N-acetylmuramoyl-pentapeptide-transferase [Firmicutes bacterium]|nr:phospho-N-acetylmuramoyl-pentapeptide-transferase [Alicyclobacillaceae bacterium]MCL6497785.1 phospho-N-acetylmuramoyl-pentapeptide-transferase [Bacillota bacterium]
MKAAWAGALGLAVAWGLGPVLIPWLRRLRFGQTVREAGPASHRKKQGTPTMGGVLFLIPVVLAVAVFDRGSLEAWALVFLIAGYGAVGLADDLLKVVFHRPLGLRAREKLFLQLAIAVVFVVLAQRVAGADQAFWLPFGLGQWRPGFWYGPLAVLAILGSSNAVNITDGLDGLAGGAGVVAMGFYALWAWTHGQPSLSLVALALVGGLIGFLRYNLHPAQVFMGDTGSLALGAAMAGAAVLSRTVLVLPVLGVLFVIETLSVIVQVASFRLTGRRVLRMSPLHHHFELSGWSEERVVSTFWLVALLGAVAAWLS